MTNNVVVAFSGGKDSTAMLLRMLVVDCCSLLYLIFRFVLKMGLFLLLFLNILVGVVVKVSSVLLKRCSVISFSLMGLMINEKFD